MFSKDLASGLIQSEGQKMRFWKFAHKCERHQLVVKVLQAIVPRKRYEKKLSFIVREQHMSSISNEYWYRLTLTKTMLQILLFFTIELIVSLFGLLVLTPLTLWRLPTFLIVFKTHHYSKRLFFKVLFTIYKLMAFDAMVCLPYLVAFIVSPVTFVRFRYGTMFRYGEDGYEELLNVQRMKSRFVCGVVLAGTLKVYKLLGQVGTIYLLYMRKAAYRA